jgi:hypothetical protein
MHAGAAVDIGGGGAETPHALSSEQNQGWLFLIAPILRKMFVLLKPFS